MSPEVSARRTLRATFRVSFLQLMADPQWLIPSMIAPVIFALVSYELFDASGPTLVAYAIVGASMMSMWGQTLYGSGWATGQDRELGTLEPVLASPSSYLWVVFGRVAGNIVTGLAGGAIVYVVVLATYGHPLPFANPLAFVVLLGFVILTLSAVGIVFAAWYVYTRYAGFISNVGEFAFYVGTGCMVPIVFLPFWSTPFALVLPPTWALDALRYAVFPGYQGLSWGFWGDVVGAVATTLAYLAVAGTVFRRVERHVIEVGNLSDY